MGDSSHESIFIIEEFPAAERGSAFSGTNPPGFGADPEHKSSPNLRRIKGISWTTWLIENNFLFVSITLAIMLFLAVFSVF